jgi:hypothetical protein
MGLGIIRDGELDSYIDGRRARRITMASIRRYIERHLPADTAKCPRGRPRKDTQLDEMQA